MKTKLRITTRHGVIETEKRGNEHAVFGALHSLDKELFFTTEDCGILKTDIVSVQILGFNHEED